MFSGAKRVREWVSTDRIQYSSRRTIGNRWCLMSHAAGFLDPLFSRGLSNTAEVINSLSRRLLDALREDNFAEERFEPVERLEQGLLDYNDDLVNCSFISFQHYELWDKVFRIWGWGTIPGSLRYENMIREFERSKDDEVFAAGENVPNTGLWWPDSAAYAVLFKNMVRLCESVEDGSVEPGAAASQLMAEIQGSGIFPPVMGLTDENTKFIVPNPDSMKDMMIWLQRSAPEDMRGLTRSLAGDRG
jgi:FADH2 O2-dependent halogenase